MSQVTKSPRPSKSRPQADRIRVKQLLAWAVKRRSTLENERCRQPDFCEALLERTLDLALRGESVALRLAEDATVLSEEIGDPHLVQRSRHVLARTHMARGETDAAYAILSELAEQALACCRRCRTSHRIAVGELLHRRGVLWPAFSVLSHASGELPEPRLDYLARILHQLAAVTYKLGRPEAALQFAGLALGFLDLDSPRGIYLDVLTIFAAASRHCGPGFGEVALKWLARFRERIKGHDFHEVLPRLRQVCALVHERMGDRRRAREELEGAWRTLLDSGSAAQALGSTIEVAWRRILPPRGGGRRWNGPNRENQDQARRAIELCQKRPDLVDEERRLLEAMLEVLEVRPEAAFDSFGALRSAIPAPVPGLGGEDCPAPPPRPIECPPEIEARLRRKEKELVRFLKEKGLLGASRSADEETPSNRP